MISRNEMLLKLYDLDKNVKIFSNKDNLSEVEIKLFCLDEAMTVSQLFTKLLECDYDCTFQDVEIIYHHDHYKRNRFYELKYKL